MEGNILKYILFIITLLLLVGLNCHLAFAQDDMGLMGRSEIQAAGAWLRIDADENTPELTVIGANYGKFVAPKFEVQGALIYGKASGTGDGGHAWLIAPAALYHFVPETPSATVPYIGAGFTYANVKADDESNDSFKFQYLAGVKFFIGGD